MSRVEEAVAHAKAHAAEALEELKALIAIPSVSTLPEHAGDVKRAAGWLADRLKGLGMSRVEVFPTGLHPIVYAEWLGAPGKPTVLVYGHYDVQPVDPVDEWVSPPFEATLRGDCLHARGASDMKGQMVAQLEAMKALVAQGDLPINIKYLIEGEEEVGSPSLESFIDEHGDLLACDFVLNCDAGVVAPDVPGIIYSLRGLAYFEIEVRGPARDLHSGIFGGGVHNPAQVLCELVAGMHDEQGRVTLPGFYDAVLPLSDEERAAIAKYPETEEDYLKITGAPGLWGEEGYTTLERIGARPTLDVNGMISGFTGEGAKTVLPARAVAKLSTRLVADQDPSAIGDQLRSYLRERAPKTVTWEVRELSHGPGALTDRHSPYIQAAARALEETFGAEVVFKREGGSVPVVGVLKERLGVDTVMLGFALRDDGIHGPNERQHLPTFHRGIETYVRFLGGL